jgi:hypothetical protein
MPKEHFEFEGNTIRMVLVRKNKSLASRLLIMKKCFQSKDEPFYEYSETGKHTHTFA